MKNKSLNIGLPVMLHDEKEIMAFLKAKRRIEEFGLKSGTEINVGVFLYYFPKVLTEEKRNLQIINQKKYKLPIIHSQTPIRDENSLIYSSENILKSENESLLEQTIYQCIKLKEYDISNNLDNFYIDTHIGLCISDKLANKVPAIISLKKFINNKENYLNRVKERFESLDNLIKKNGLGGMVLENSPSISYEIDKNSNYQRNIPIPYFFPFSDINSLSEISKNKITLDISHLSASRNAIKYLDNNKAKREKEILFSMEGVNSIKEYNLKHPIYGDYLPYLKAIHMSNRVGIGTHLNGFPEYINKWGNEGMIKGEINKLTLRKLFKYAQEKSIPIIIEVDYDIKKIPENNYNEADDLLKYAL